MAWLHIYVSTNTVHLNIMTSSISSAKFYEAYDHLLSVS